MKTTRILSLLFSVSQFILVLKLIEYVRGEETELAFKTREPKHFFVAPGIQKRKKNKPWLTTSSTTEESISTTDTSKNSSESSELGIDEYKFQRKIINYNETLSNNITKRNDSKIQLGKIEKIGLVKQENIINSSSTSNAENVANHNTGRLCPTCANGGCDGNVQGSSFPIIPIIVSVVAAVIWFFIFLWIVLGSKKDEDTTEGYGYSGGSLGGSLPSITYNNNMAKSINDFLGSEEIASREMRSRRGIVRVRKL